MGKKLFSVIILLATCVLSNQAQVFRNEDLTISKLEDKVWVVETTDNTTMYIIEGNDKAMLIDTGTRCSKLNEVVKKITGKPLYVVLTHMHGDHAGNIRYFDEIYFHKDDMVLMQGSGYKGKMNYVNDGQVFDLGGKKIEVVHMPGHTPGSIVLLDREAGICYSGDSFGSGQVWLQVVPVMPVRIYANSLKRMQKIMESGISKIYCGHYPYVKKYYERSYIDEMLYVAEALDKGTNVGAVPYDQVLSSGTRKPMIATKGEASIVYDPDRLK